MDYEKLIDNNACLKTYFSEFPKKLKQLAAEGEVMKFFENGIEIFTDKLCDYLLSKSSIFQIHTITDFFETLQILQFSKKCISKHKVSYIFINPNFGEDKELSDDFYKQAIDITDVNLLKGTKRMSPTHYINLFNRIIAMDSRRKVTKFELNRFNLTFNLMKRQAEVISKEDVIDSNVFVPEYVKNNEIAGYYGNVDLLDLKKVFHKYFPIYQEANSEVETEQDAENVFENEPMESMDIDNPQGVPDLISPDNREVSNNVIEDENTSSTMENDKEKLEPPKKQRKHMTRGSKITIKETNDALMNLEKEFGTFSNDCNDEF